MSLSVANGSHGCRPRRRFADRRALATQAVDLLEEPLMGQHYVRHDLLIDLSGPTHGSL
jgi:hypothetical protein